MATLPSVSGEQALRAFQKAGWRKDRQRGSHVILVKPGHHASLSVPSIVISHQVRYDPCCVHLGRLPRNSRSFFESNNFPGI